MATLFSVEVSRGSINRLRNQVSEAVAIPVEQAHEYVKEQSVVHSDETGFSQGNGDGLNPRGRKGWLWVLVTPLVKVFSVVLSRNGATAKALIGEEFKGILIRVDVPVTRVCQIICVRSKYLEWKSTLKFNRKSIQCTFPISNRHSPFFRNIVDC